jgi:hypothetical protein
MQVKKFRNWMIHITIIKRWLFSRCRLCGNRFTWKDCATGHVLSPSLNGCGPKWFRNAENIVHMPTCDPQTWKQDYDEAVTDSTRTRASQSHWGKIYYTNRQYAKQLRIVNVLFVGCHCRAQAQIVAPCRWPIVELRDVGDACILMIDECQNCGAVVSL